MRRRETARRPSFKDDESRAVFRLNFPPPVALLRGGAVDEGAHLADVLVERGDAVEDDLDGAVGEAGFEREGVAGEDVARVVGAPEEEVVVAQVEELLHQPGAVLRLVDVDVVALVVGVDAEADGLVVRDADDDLEALGVLQIAALDGDEVEGVLVALPEGDLDALLGALGCEQRAQLLARRLARGLLLGGRLRGGRGRERQKREQGYDGGQQSASLHWE